jgi:uroporphyrinogen decarboxylase
MKELSSYERMKRMYEHRDADRVPIMSGPWESTIVRWRREGMPEDARVQEYFDIDRIAHLYGIDTSPRFPREVLEETDTYIIDRDAWGTTKKNWKPMSSTPLEIDHLISSPETWAPAKERMMPSRDRIDWPSIERAYKQARAQESWLVASLWFGYDIVNARMIGTETLLLAMAERPEWVKDVLDTLTDLALGLLDLVWAEGYDFDELQWPDDMGYKNGMLFSMRMWRAMVQPYQQRAIDWAHAHGCKAHMHSCGNIMAVVPELADMGLDGLNPMEIKAGMDPLGIKRDLGDRLLLKGGLDARNFDVYEQAEADIEEKVPVLMESGGYCFASDHSVPDSVGLETYKRIIACAKRVGSYR